jgi:hypothetical protein
MPKHPDVFPDIDVSSIELPDGIEPEFLAGGFNSSAWMVGNQVLKVTSRSQNERAATELRDAMQHEHDTLELYIGQNMVESEYRLTRELDGAGFRVLTVQPFVEGTTLKDFFAKPDADAEPFMSFLELAREGYRQTGLMPDIGCIEKRFFWPLADSNTLIREEQGNQPILVDTTSGKTQRRSDVVGKLWNGLIYARAGQAINHLSWRLHEMEVGAESTAHPVQAEEL